MKKYLFILSRAAHSGVYLQETLDVILTTAAFDQSVSILLVDAGVFNLKKNQQTTDLNLKDTCSIFAALELYDVNTIYVEDESMKEFGIDEKDLAINTKNIKRTDIGLLMRQFDIIYSG